MVRPYCGFAKFFPSGPPLLCPPTRSISGRYCMCASSDVPHRQAARKTAPSPDCNCCSVAEASEMMRPSVWKEQDRKSSWNRVTSSKLRSREGGEHETHRDVSLPLLNPPSTLNLNCLPLFACVAG